MNNNNVFQGIDLLEILAFYVQLKNIQWDQDHNSYIKSVIQNINTEIEKLHRQNDIIMQQNEQILKLLQVDNN